MKITSLKLERVGQIVGADVEFGDLTILVGPQATGKSVFLQFLKLAADTGYVHDQLKKHGSEWKRTPEDFLDVYLGEGMKGIWRKGENHSIIEVNGQPLDLTKLVRSHRRSTKSSLFYIPAQRVLSLANGWPRPFQGFAPQDPFAVRDFSETFRLLMEQEFSRSDNLFPKANRLKSEYRDLLTEHVFGGFGLKVDRQGAQKRLVLQQEKSFEQVSATPTETGSRVSLQEAPDKVIPFMAWSAGQREFVPLLMGLYWLMPVANSRRSDTEWVVIEELEMGLHPCAISAVLLLVLELLWRGYRVCLSTHSQHVLDVVWALRMMKEHGAESGRLLDIFKVNKTDQMKRLADSVLKKSVKVYYFDRDGTTRDISHLDPGSEDELEAGWGGLSEFSGRVADVVADVVNASPKKSEAVP